MSDKALLLWFLFFTSMLVSGIVLGVYINSDKMETSLPTLTVSATATLEQLSETYLVTAGQVGGHMYLFIRLKNEETFTVKHAAMCQAAHPEGFDG